MGCTVLIYAETSGGIAGDRRRSLSSRPRLDDADWRDFGSRLTELGDRLSRRGIRLPYHHHVGTIVEIQGSQQTCMGLFLSSDCFWVFLTVLCSERERPFFIPSPAIRFPERAEGVKGPKR